MAAQGAFNTGTGTTAIVVDGLGFTPALVLFTWGGQTSSVDALTERTQRRGFGLAISTTDRRAVCNISVHASASAVTRAGHRDDACVLSIASNNIIDGRLDLQSMDVGGFTLAVDDAMPEDFRVHYVAFTADEVTAAQSGHFLGQAGVGNQDVTGLPYQPDLVLFFGANLQISPTGATGGQAGSNFLLSAARSATEEYVCYASSDDTAATMDTGSYCRAGEVLVSHSGDINTLTTRAEFVQMLATGFRVNFTQYTTQRFYHYLAIKGPSLKLGDVLTQTDTNQFAETGVGFQPSALFVVSACKAESASGTVDAPDKSSVGVAISASERGAHGVIDRERPTSQIGVAVEHDALYVNLLDHNTISIEGLMDLVSMDADGFTAVMDDADTAQAFAWYLAVGAAAAGPVEKAGSDSLSVSASDVVASILGTLLVSDVLTAAATEVVQDTSVRLERGDALGVALADAISAVLVTLARTDALSPSLSDAVEEVSVVLTANDALAASLVDAVAELLSQLALTDDLSVGLTDAVTALQVTLARQDALGLSLSDVAELVNQVVGSDSASVSISEGVVQIDFGDEDVVTKNVQDAIGLRVDDIVTALQVSLARQDALALALADTPTLVVTFTRTDALGVSVTEQAATVVVLERSDLLSVRVADAVDAVSVTLLRSDDLRVAVDDDTSAILSDLLVSDALSVAVTDAGQIVIAITASDLLSLSLTEAADQVQTNISALIELVDIALAQPTLAAVGVAQAQLASVALAQSMLDEPRWVM